MVLVWVAVGTAAGLAVGAVLVFLALRARASLLGEVREAVVDPLRASLERVDERVRQLDKERAGAYAALHEQVRSLATTQAQLHRETAGLGRALRVPHVRGRWGELQLRRVVELAGMLDHCDFFEQPTVGGGEGGRLRPDLVVRLPGGRNVVVDSKAPLAAYLEAHEATDDETRVARLIDHARQVRQHVHALASKAYWHRLEPTPEFVVLFLPGEALFGAALEHDPALIEYGVDQRVLMATPTTLIALLRAVSYGWRQEQVAQNAAEISRLGRDLYERLRVFSGHLAGLRKGLETSVVAYNRAVGSFEARVLTSARQFERLGASSGDGLAVLEPIDELPRESLPLPDPSRARDTFPRDAVKGDA